MVLGHDFHSVDGYRWAMKHEAENLNSPTWRNLKTLLDRVSLPLEACFFTNVYMGLRKGSATTGVFPGARAPKFVKRCQDFLLRQIALQRPRLILALGSHVPALLAPLSRQLVSWSGPGSFRRRDSEGTSLVSGAIFKHAKVKAVVVSLIHPCCRAANIRNRRWRGLIGNEAELLLVREAMGMARIGGLRAKSIWCQSSAARHIRARRAAYRCTLEARHDPAASRRICEFPDRL
jgi:hypothetical protein